MFSEGSQKINKNNNIFFSVEDCKFVLYIINCINCLIISFSLL